MMNDADSRPLHPLVMRGWRHFRCGMCNAHFREPSRDHANWMPQEFSRLAAWGEPTVVGDSGNPVFLGARHELANNMIEGLSPRQGYRLTQKSL